MLGLNIVEFSGDDEAEINQLTESLCQRLDELMANNCRRDWLSNLS